MARGTEGNLGGIGRGTWGAGPNTCGSNGGGGGGQPPTHFLGLNCLWQLCRASNDSLRGTGSLRTCWVPGAEPGLSLEILQDRLLLMLRDLSRALRRTRPRWKFRLLSWSTALPLWRSWARPWRGSGSLTWRTRTRIRLCGPRACRGRPKTTAPRVPGGEAGPPGAEGPGRGPAVSRSESAGGCLPGAAGAEVGDRGDLVRGWGAGATRGETVEPQVPSPP